MSPKKRLELVIFWLKMKLLLKILLLALRKVKNLMTWQLNILKSKELMKAYGSEDCRKLTTLKPRFSLRPAAELFFGQ